MQIYLDTANVKEIQEGANLGLIDGVTTNPSLVAKEGRSFKEMLLEICKMVDGPISAEVVGRLVVRRKQDGRRRPCWPRRRARGVSRHSSVVSTT